MVRTGTNRDEMKVHVVDVLHIHNKVMTRGMKLMVVFQFFKYDLLPLPSYQAIGLTTQQTNAVFASYFVNYNHPLGPCARKSRRLADVCPINLAVHGKFVFRNTIIHSQHLENLI